jgi:hypothetical protein
MMKKICIVFLSALMFNFAVAQTDEASEKRRIAKEILTETMGEADFKKMPQQLAPVLMDQFKAVFQRQNPPLSAQQVARISEVFGKIIIEDLDSYMTSAMPVLSNTMEAFYVERFSLEELKEVHRFHSSPVGKKQMRVTMEELPRLMAPIMSQAQNIGPRIAPRMQQAIRQLQAEGVLPASR